MIIFGRVFIYFCTIFCFLPFFLLFIQIARLWILILRIKVSNFLVDILKLQGNKFLKVNKVANKTFVIAIISLDVHVLIRTHVYYIRRTVGICVIVYPVFQSVDFLKGALLCLRRFSATEITLKMVKNSFYFTLEALFVLKIFQFWSCVFGYLEKRLD